MAINVDFFTQSGAAAHALRRELQRRDDAHMPEMTAAEAEAFVAESERKNVFGFDYKTDRAGNPIQQGIGAWPDKVTANHFASLLRYEGKESWAREVRRLWKEAPQVARKIGLPELPRVGA